MIHKCVTYTGIEYAVDDGSLLSVCPFIAAAVPQLTPGVFIYVIVYRMIIPT